MRTYKDKTELKNEIHKSFEKYIAEFDDIPESLKDTRVAEVDRTPAENLAYPLGGRRWFCNGKMTRETEWT